MGDSGGGADNKPKAIHWTEMLEEYFASTGEKAHCLSWCHKQAEQMYSNRKTWIDLPVIVISGVTGFLSAGSTTMFSDPAASSIALGVASLFVSVLNTAGSYYGWAKRAEGHRISAIHYARLYRFISVELALPREERMMPNDFLKYVKDQYDRLQEISPLLPPEVIASFQKKFAKETEISKPEEANGLEKITVFRGTENLDVSDPGESRTPQFKIRTPKLAKIATAAMGEMKANLENPLVKMALDEAKKNPGVEALKNNPLFKAAQMARKLSPDVLAADAPAPPPELSPPRSSSSSEVSVVVEEEESKTSS
jgi:hypothetical protein